MTPESPCRPTSFRVGTGFSRFSGLRSAFARWATTTPNTEIIHQLFLLNVSLQLFDGVATYYGISHPLHEANPILGTVMAQMGIGVALLLSKSAACAGLVVLRSLAGRGVAFRALTGVAVTYGIFSFIPWTAWNLSRL